MSILNNVIAAIDEAGLRQNAYSTINTIALYISLLVGLMNGRKLKVGIIATIVTVAAEYFLSGPIVSAALYVEFGFRVTSQKNGAIIFSYIPLIGYLVSKVLRKSYKEIWDVIIVIPLTMFAGARIACTITGCCRGYPFFWGVFNPVEGKILFPIQLVESFVSILILAYVFWREKKNDFIPDGRNVPIILLSYGTARFILEFLHDNGKIILGVNLMQFRCVLMVIVGIVTLRMIQKSENETAHPKGTE